MPKSVPTGRKEIYKGPDLDKFIGEEKRNYVSYATGAKIYSMSYYAFMNLAKKAGANKRVKKCVVVDLDKIEAYLDEYCNAIEEEADVQT